MHGTGQRDAARNRQEGKNFAGEDDRADHGPQHRSQKQQVDHRLHDPHRRVFSPKQAAVPPEIEGVVDNPEHKHPRAQPLVGDIPRQLLCHQQ